MLLRCSLGLALVLLSACNSDVAVSPPAEQRTLLYQPQALGSFVRMNQTNAEQHFVSGIYTLEANAWRWTGGQAVLRLYLKETAGLQYAMKFAVPREVLTHHAPMHIRIRLNGQPWEELRYDKDGIYDFAKPVPAGLLKPQAENLVTIEIAEPLPSNGRGPELGFILVEAGFQPAAGDA